MKRMKDKRVRDELLADTQRDEILKKRRESPLGKKDVLAFKLVEFEVKVGYLSRNSPERCEDRG